MSDVIERVNGKFVYAEDILELFYVASAGQDRRFVEIVEQVIEDAPDADVVERSSFDKLGQKYLWYQQKHLNGELVEVVRCKKCKYGRTIDKEVSPEKYFKSDCVVCECKDVVGDEPAIYPPTHFCGYGERSNT